jgi:hypothetical protein
MHSTLRLAIVAGVLALAFARAAAAPLAGRWEGSAEGRKAVTLELRESPALAGTVVFYITNDDATGEHNGDALPAMTLNHLRWEAEVLHFDVDAGDRTVALEMRSAGEGKATLKRIASGDVTELTLVLTALR